jgi:hypothetical protein
VPDPRLAVLEDTPRQFRAIRIRLTESRARAAAETGSPDGPALE